MISIAPRTNDFHIEIDSIAPDKSISHRCAMFSLLSDRPSIVRNYLLAHDTRSTLTIATHLGLQVEELESHSTHSSSKNSGNFRFIPPKRIQEPNCVLDCGNAGTAMRLYAGLLSAQKGYFVLSGDEYLCARPMKRVIEPLRSIGAQMYARAGGLAPLSIIGGELNGFHYHSAIASAQVKSALILAGLYAKEPSIYIENERTRDHTERMLCGMGATLTSTDSSSENASDSNTNAIHITPLHKPLSPLDISIPADPSSAFFFALAAAITPDSSVLLKNVLLNKTRIEAFKVLESMGTLIEYRTTSSLYEEIGDIYVKYAPLRAIHISERISWLIDELPALGIAMCFANGTSRVSNAQELRVKESDRIHALIHNLQALGVQCSQSEDGFSITGIESTKLDSSYVIDSFADHRIAMSFAIMGLRCGISISDEACMAISFPNFTEILRAITDVSTR